MLNSRSEIEDRWGRIRSYYFLSRSIKKEEWPFYSNSKMMIERVKRIACGSNIGNTEHRKRRFNGKLRFAQYAGEKERERESKHKTLFKIILNLCFVHRVCSMNTFIKVLLGLTEVLTVLQCSLKSPYTNS